MAYVLKHIVSGKYVGTSTDYASVVLVDGDSKEVKRFETERDAAKYRKDNFLLWDYYETIKEES